MSPDLGGTTYRAVPAYLIRHAEGVIIKRGTLETFVRGDGAFQVLQHILGRAIAGATLDELRSDFPIADQLAVDYLLGKLVDRRLLVPADNGNRSEVQETPEGIFYWEFDDDVERVRARLSETRMAIIGVNEISRELVASLIRSGVENCQVIDFARLRSARLFRRDGVLDVDQWAQIEPLPLAEWETALKYTGVECVVGTAEHGGGHWLRDWNEWCLVNGHQFMPVVLQNLIGYVGPLVIPGETACFECLRARQNSNLARPDEERASELVALESQAVLSFHPLMPRAVAQIAAMELIKFFSGALPFARAGLLVEVDLLTPALTRRKVLRIPSCPVCGRLRTYSPTSASATENRLGGQ